MRVRDKAWLNINIHYRSNDIHQSYIIEPERIFVNLDHRWFVVKETITYISYEIGFFLLILRTEQN